MCGIEEYNIEDAESALKRTNYYRRFVGFINEATLNRDPKIIEEQLRCVVVSKHLGKNTHKPNDTMQCYTKEAYTGCSNSNLCMCGPTSTNDVDVYMDDNLVSSVGHRIWVLNPKNVEFAYASIGRWGAMRVIGLKTQSDEGIPFIAYPPPGPVPHLVSYRWTFSAKDPLKVDSIEIWENDTKVELSVKPYNGSDYSYTRNTIAFAINRVYHNTAYHVKIVGNGNEYRYTTVFVKCIDGEDYDKIIFDHPAHWNVPPEPEKPETNPESDYKGDEKDNANIKEIWASTPTGAAVISIIVILVVIGISIGGVFLYRKYQKDNSDHDINIT